MMDQYNLSWHCTTHTLPRCKTWRFKTVNAKAYHRTDSL